MHFFWYSERMNTLSIKQMLLDELEREAGATRKALERVPAAKADWKPHEKSMSLGKLAPHVATLPRGIVSVVKEKVMEIGGYRPPMPEADGPALVAAFDKHLAEAKAALEIASDETLGENWKMTLQGKTLIDMPRHLAIQTIFINHLVHHRAQLGVYLRMNGIAVPATYGPSSDEPV